MIDTELALGLSSALNLSNTEWQKARLFDRRPLERDRIVSALSYAVGDFDLQYLHAVLEDPRDVGTSATVVAFTERTVAVLRYSSARLFTDVVPRSSLQGIRLLRTPALTANGGGDKLCLELNYALVFSDEPKVVLGHKHQTEENASALREFLADLKQDLLR